MMMPSWKISRESEGMEPGHPADVGVVRSRDGVAQDLSFVGDGETGLCPAVGK